jgi:hypothetical protein
MEESSESINESLKNVSSTKKKNQKKKLLSFRKKIVEAEEVLEKD